MTTQDFYELSRDKSNSWALWNTNGENDINYFKSNQKRLHGRVIFLGLNRSNGANKVNEYPPFKNFHAEKHTGDRRLQTYIQTDNLKNLIGGFMTDISDVIETDSNKVNIDLQSILNHFKSKLSLIKSNERNIICFGNKVFNSICTSLGIKKTDIQVNPEIELKFISFKVETEVWNIYRVWHYSNYGRFLNKSMNILPRQLRFIDGISV